MFEDGIGFHYFGFEEVFFLISNFKTKYLVLLLVHEFLKWAEKMEDGFYSKNLFYLEVIANFYFIEGFDCEITCIQVEKLSYRRLYVPDLELASCADWHRRLDMARNLYDYSGFGK